MATCETIDLVAYMEGALEEEERRRVETHLATCEVCCRSLEELDEAKELLVEAWTAGGVGCPPAEALGVHLTGGGDDALRRALERHLDRCAVCGELVEVLRAFEAEWTPPAEGETLPDALRERLATLAERGLAERVRRAAEAALGREAPPEGAEAAAWLERLLSREPDAWPLAALPKDAAEVEEDEDEDEDEQTPPKEKPKS
jgi:anti-sigma factor RsiW